MDETRGDLPSSEPPEHGEDRLSPRERETAGELRRLNPHLAGLYERGLVLVRQIDQPGNAYLVAHVGRELSRGVLELLFSAEGLEVAPEDIENAPSNEKHRPRIAEALGLEPDDPRVDEWFHLHRQFSRACHWRGSAPKSAEVREAFERFASLLYGRIAPYYVTEAELDALLETKIPTRDHAKRLRDLQLRHAQRNYFFRRLRNPGWVRPLAAEGFFRSPPGRQKNADGSWRAGPWPEGDYLVFAADEEPTAVLEVLNSIPRDNDNPVVWDLVAKAGRQLPPEMAACIVPSLRNALRTVPTWIFTESVVDLLVVLAEEGKEEAFELAAFLLRVVDPEELEEPEGLRFRPQTGWAFPCFSTYDCAKLLRRVVVALEASDANRTLRFLLSKASRLQGLADHPNLRLGGRFSTIHAESEPDRTDVVAMFLKETMAVGQRLAAGGHDEASSVMEAVDHHSAALVTRIGYLVLSKAGQHLQDRINEVLGSTEFREPGLPATEIAALLRTQFRNASPEARQEYAAAVEAGPNRETLRVNLRPSFGRYPTQEEIDDHIARYQRRILTFYRGDIPEELRDLAERLGVLNSTPSRRDQELAEIGWSGGAVTSVGEESPISVDELGRLSVDEIVTLLVAGIPGEGIGSSYGLRNTLTAYSKESVGTALAVLNGVLGHDVDPDLVEAIISGLCEAADSGSDLDWPTALAVVRRTFSHVRSLDPSEGAHVRAWRRTAGRAARFLEIGCDKNAVAHEHTEEVWGILGEATSAPTIWDVAHSDDRSLKSVVTATLNDATGNVANAAISAALWDYRSLTGDEREASPATKAAARTAVQGRLVPVLGRWLRDDGPNGAVVRAVMGDYLPQLHLLAPEWMVAHAANLFERGIEDPASWPTWTFYIFRHRVYDEVFRATRPWYLVAASKARVWQEAVGDSFPVTEITQSYGEHLIVGVLRGLVSVGDEDALLETAYEHLIPSDWHRAYWGIFRAWSDAENPPPKVFVRRLLSLWEWRVSELGANPDLAATLEEAKELSWLFHTPYLPDADRIRLGFKTARLARGQLEMYSRWDQMLSLAEGDADGAFLIAEAILLAELRADHYPHVPVEDIRPFLAHILTAGSPHVRDRARHLINRLGERGYRQLKDLLDDPGGTNG